MLEALRRACLMGIDKFGKWTELVLYPTLEKAWQEENPSGDGPTLERANGP